MNFRCSLAVPIGALAFLLATVGVPHATPTLIAIPDIGFTDSSGEPTDQAAQHEARRRALTQGLRQDVESGGRLESLALPCREDCALDQAGVERLRQQAREAGAAFVLVGSVHKMSTLVLSMRVGVLDVASGKLVMERLLSFRGDNDDGWRHMGSFVAREVASTLTATP